MGVMIDGEWTTDEQASALTYRDGRWQRPQSAIRHWVTSDGEAGPSGDGGFRAEAGRYHLFVSYGCPWAHRTMIFRVLKGLEDVITLSVTRPRRTDQGWVFDNGPDREFSDDCLGKHALWEVYADGHPGFTGRVTVPVLFDKQTGRVVSNESSDIIRMLNRAFNDVGGNDHEYYPEALRAEIGALNDRIYEDLNNGVYRAGFARTQAAYEEGFDDVFGTLDFLDNRLERQRYLCGSRQTEADWRLFPTLVRFDVAYHHAFKCNLRRLVDYPNIWPYTRDLYQTPGIAQTVFPDVYKSVYHSIRESGNGAGIIPKGPLIDFTAPHDRARSA